MHACMQFDVTYNVGNEVRNYDINRTDRHPSLTVEEQKNGCKASKIKACSRFLFRSDMCFCAIFFAYGKFISFVCLMMLRIVDFLINS